MQDFLIGSSLSRKRNKQEAYPLRDTIEKRRNQYLSKCLSNCGTQSLVNTRIQSIAYSIKSI